MSVMSCQGLASHVDQDVNEPPYDFTRVSLE